MSKKEILPYSLFYEEQPLHIEIKNYLRLHGILISESTALELSYEAQKAWDEGNIWTWMNELPKKDRFGPGRKKMIEDHKGLALTKRQRDSLRHFRKAYFQENGIELDIPTALSLYPEWKAKKDQIRERRKAEAEAKILKQQKVKETIEYMDTLFPLSHKEKMVLINIYSKELKRYDSIMDASREFDTRHSFFYTAAKQHFVLHGEWMVLMHK